MCSAFENAINSWSIRGRHRIFQDIVLPDDTFGCLVIDWTLLLADVVEHYKIDWMKSSETCPEDGKWKMGEGKRNSAFTLPTLHYTSAIQMIRATELPAIDSFGR